MRRTVRGDGARWTEWMFAGSTGRQRRGWHSVWLDPGHFNYAAMSLWVASLLALMLLAFPWVMMPRRSAGELHGVVELLWWLNAMYCAFWHRLVVKGRDPLPKEGPCILICNHTCCIDHMLLQAGTRRLLGFIIAREIYEIRWFKPFCDLSGCIPVNRDGKDLAAMRAALRALHAGRVLPIFPEGTITPTSGRELGGAKPGVAFIALKARVPVIPAYIRGTPSTNKIGPSLWTPSRAELYFGPAVELDDLRDRVDSSRDDLEEVCQRMMAAIRVLRDHAQSADGWRAPRGLPEVDDSDDGRSEERALALSGDRSAAL
jgi:1-acyl-sn-glycerol-3-phosphate acyltransferase